MNIRVEIKERNKVTSQNSIIKINMKKINIKTNIIIRLEIAIDIVPIVSIIKPIIKLEIIDIKAESK